MLHGFGDTGDMWEPFAEKMVHDNTVIVPDLRGMGLSSHPDDGYTKKAQAVDMGQVLDRLHVATIQLITHDTGNMVGYALAAQQPDRVTKWVAMDAPLPGLGHWDDEHKNPKTWHFNFHGPDEERLVEGRERLFLDRFYNELSADPKHIDEESAFITPPFMRGRTLCTGPSSSSRHSRRSRSTTSSSSLLGES